jgi:hypothetical protein
LDEESVDAVIGIQPFDGGAHLGFSRGRGQAVSAAPHAHLVGRFLFVAHVHLRRRVVADENDVEPRHAIEGGAKLRDARRDFSADFGGYQFAIEDLGGHGADI